MQSLIWDNAICYNRIFSGSVLQNENKNDREKNTTKLDSPCMGPTLDFSNRKLDLIAGTASNLQGSGCNCSTFIEVKTTQVVQLNLISSLTKIFKAESLKYLSL